MTDLAAKDGVSGEYPSASIWVLFDPLLRPLRRADAWLLVDVLALLVSFDRRSKTKAYDLLLRYATVP